MRCTRSLHINVFRDDTFVIAKCDINGYLINVLCSDDSSAGSRMMSGSTNKLYKKGSTCSSRSGQPKFIRRIPKRRGLLASAAALATAACIVVRWCSLLPLLLLLCAEAAMLHREMADCRAASRPFAELKAKPLTLWSYDAIDATTTTTLTLIFIGLTGAQCEAEETALASGCSTIISRLVRCSAQCL
jgi:hypothetical protein